MRNQPSSTSLQLIRWRCSRRGMLELDILLSRFFDKHYQLLSEAEQQLFQQLLDYPDPQLFDWLLKQEQPNQNDLAVLVQKIRNN